MIIHVEKKSSGLIEKSEVLELIFRD